MKCHAMWAGVCAAGLVLAMTAAAWAGPVLETDKSEWKMGKVARNETRTTTFTLKNSGDEPLVISQIRPSCKSCLGKMQGDTTLKPGESRPLDVAYQAVDAYGQRQMSVTIHSNDPEHPLVRLRLSVEVVPQKNKPVLTIEPAAIDIGVVSAGQSATTKVELGNVGDAPLDVQSIVPSAGLRPVNASKDAIAPGAKATVTFEVLPRAKGVIQESVGFQTTDPDRPIVEVAVTGYAQAGGPSGSASAAPAAPAELTPMEKGILIVPTAIDGDGKPGAPTLTIRNDSAFDVIVRSGNASEGSEGVTVKAGAEPVAIAPGKEAGSGSETVSLEIIIGAEPAAEPARQ